MAYTGKPCKDYLGNEFSSLVEMCTHYGIDYGTFKTRRRSGLTLEECLLGCKFKDHLGNKFGTLLEMCEYYGVSKQTFFYRRSKGWTLEECLLGKKSGVDHLGNRYSSIAEMCEHYNVPIPTFYGRRERGWTLKECLLGKESEVDSSDNYDEHGPWSDMLDDADMSSINSVDDLKALLSDTVPNLDLLSNAMLASFTDASDLISYIRVRCFPI